MPIPGDQHRDTPATTNPFLEQKPRVSEFSAKEIATLQSRLDKQLGPEYVSTRPGNGGGKVHYLAAEKAINLANEVFGFNGWSSSIQNVQIDFVDENPQNGKISLGLSTIVRVTLKDGTFHEDIGYGHIENCKGKAPAFEKAKKEAATDAMKRALRTFGNVLGNCLYDKDYLSRVQKIKIAPSRWDAENLHRHPDYAPIKRESIAGASGAQQQQQIQQRPNGAGDQRQTSMQSAGSFGSAEFEEDFGGIEFDETDFSHADDITIDTPAKPPPQNGHQRQGVGRVQSMPQMKPPSAPSAAPVQNPQGTNKPPAPPRPPNNAAQGQQNRPQAPQVPNNPQRGAAQSNFDGAANRSNPSSATSNNSHHPNQQPQNPAIHPQQAHQNNEPDSNGLPAPRQPPPGNPDGFVTGRSADLVNQPTAANTANKPPNNAMAFNPHADSPSIRRTHGINPGKSAPVTRSSIQQTGASNGPVQQQANVQNTPHAGGGPNGMQGQGNSMNGNTTPVRTNFINPSADTNRRIGMPQAGGAGIQNRGAYRSPAPVGYGNPNANLNGGNAGPGANGGGYAGMKRPPLSDVSNLQAQQAQMDGSGDVKKPRVDVEGENAGGVGVVEGA